MDTNVQVLLPGWEPSAMDYFLLLFVVTWIVTAIMTVVFVNLIQAKRKRAMQWFLFYGALVLYILVNIFLSCTVSVTGAEGSLTGVLEATTKALQRGHRFVALVSFCWIPVTFIVSLLHSIRLGYRKMKKAKAARQRETQYY